MNLGLGLGLVNQRPSKVVKNFSTLSSLPAGCTFTRASTATRWTSSATLSTEAIDAPRFDHNPLTLAPLGLLMEVARTNRIRHNSDFTNAAWIKGAAPFAVASNAVTGPDGTLTADTLTLTAANGSGFDVYQSSTGYTVGATMIAEGWVRLGTATNFAVVMNNGAAWNTVGGQTFTASDGLSTAAWKKIVFAFTVPASGNLNLHLGCHGQTGGQAQQTAGTVHLWGFRVTAAAGSEIPTTTATVAQSADILTLPLPNGVWDITVTDAGGSQTVRRSVYGGSWTVIPRTGSIHVTSIRAVLVRSLATGLDSYTMGWFGENNIVDSAMQSKYLTFVSLLDTVCPNIASNLMLVPCRDGEGYLKPFGKGISAHPSQLRGNFREVGTVTKSAAGASIAYATNWANRIETPSGYIHGTHRSEPVFMGVVYKNTPGSGAKFANGTEIARWNVGTTSPFIGNFSGGDTQTPAFQTGVGMNGTLGGNYIMANALANNSLDAPQFLGFDFQHGRQSIAQLSNENYQLATHASASPSTSAIGTPLYFYPAIRTTGTTTGQLQYLVFIAGGIVSRSAEAQKFWDILRGTLLSDVITPIHFHQGGQSLSSGYLQRALQMVINTDRTVTTTAHGYGGTPISNWVGTNAASPVRGSQYLGGFYKGDGTASAEARWPTGNSSIPKWVVWLQGESDTEARSTAIVYQQQLSNLFAFLTADFGSDFKMAVNLLDYSIGYRTTAIQGDVTLSGLSGSGSAANGAWLITAITATTSGSTVTNANTAYTWTKSGGGTISKNGSGLWEIAISGTVYATADQVTAHPELVTSWTLTNGASGTPAWSETRAGNIERVRAAQAAFAAANPTRVVTFDSRGVTRPVDTGASGDAVHPDNAGQDLLAVRAKTAMLSI